MFSRLLRNYDYSKTLDNWYARAAGGGATAGLAYWLVNEGGEQKSLLQNVGQAGIAAGIGMLGGIGSLALHPFIAVGAVAGVPAYFYQLVKTTNTANKEIAVSIEKMTTATNSSRG